MPGSFGLDRASYVGHGLAGWRGSVLAVLGMLHQETRSLSTIWIPVGAALAIALMGISPTYIIAGLVFMALLYALIMHPDE